MMKQNKALTSVVSYPERGQGGNNRYRGNCSPKLIEDLIAHFRLHEVCDYMCGSNTTADAARTMGIVSHTYDLHSGFDLLHTDIKERPEFIFWHPPYWDIKKNEEAIEAHSVRIAELMKEHEHGILTTTTDKLLVDFVTSTSRRVSSEYLKQNYPSIYEEARKPSKNRKVKVTIQPL